MVTFVTSSDLLSRKKVNLLPQQLNFIIMESYFCVIHNSHEVHMPNQDILSARSVAQKAHPELHGIKPGPYVVNRMAHSSWHIPKDNR